MDILGEILKQVLAGAAEQQAPQQRAPTPQQRAPQAAPPGMPSPDDLADIFKQIFGGGSAEKLPEVVKQFEEKGMRDQVDSWVRPGPNKPVDRRQIDELARKRNIDREQLAEVLSRYLPKIIDELTPSGQVQARR
ncbi:MAG: YidB family protein [Planctomycetia bacterium]|nr:YidB family protein [Planctomycetia bacterium]